MARVTRRSEWQLQHASLGAKKKKPPPPKPEDDEDEDEDLEDCEDKRSLRGAKYRSRSRSRRELPVRAVSILKAWLVSPDHFSHPYPTAGEQARLIAETGIDKKQLKNWFTNARRRIWKPLVVRQNSSPRSCCTTNGSPRDDDSSMGDNNGNDQFDLIADNTDNNQSYVSVPLVSPSPSPSSSPKEQQQQQQQQQQLLQQQQQQEQEQQLQLQQAHGGCSLESRPLGSMGSLFDAGLLGSSSYLDSFVDETLPDDPKLQHDGSFAAEDDVSSNRSNRSLSEAGGCGGDNNSVNAKSSSSCSSSAGGGDNNCQSTTVVGPLPRGSVRVEPTQLCAFCAHGQVDTQLVPCSHLFHGHCLRPWLEATVTTPSCPVCSITIANCVLATVNNNPPPGTTPPPPPQDRQNS